MNYVFLIGRLTKDPVLSESETKNSYCRFNLAVDRGRNKNGEKEADFINIVAFGKTAENLCTYVGKGNLIAVEGEVRTGKYEKSGETVFTEKIIANRIEFLQWKKDAEGSVIQDEGSEAIIVDEADDLQQPDEDDGTPF